MDITTRLTTLGIVAALAFTACGDPGDDPSEEIPGDDAEASFGGAGAKADGRFSECQMSEALKLVNESSSTPDALTELGVNRRAANAIWQHRLGADGELGTGDDELFDDFVELDAVSWVGPVTLEQLVFSIEVRCRTDLNRPFIDRNTFATSTGGGWARDNVELEAAMAITGVSSPMLLSILEDTDRRGRTVFSRLRRVKALEGLSYDYPVDEVRWDDEAMEAREALPWVALTIEAGRYEPDENDGIRELSLGTDIMDDIYYDTDDRLLLDNGMTVRGRIRWDDQDTIRRLLIASKFDSSVDDEGLKRAAKIDVRTDSPDRHVATLNEDVMGGTVSWSSRPAPVEPIEAVYRRLEQLDVLPDVQGYPDVLLLDPKLHVRSFRSRFHFNEASLDSVKRYHVNGRSRIADVNRLLEEKLADGSLSGALRTQAQQLLDLGVAILDGEAVMARVALTPSTVRPDEFATPTTAEELANQREIADAVFDLMHEYAALLDDIDEELSTSRTDGFEDFAEMFVLWRKSVDTSLRVKSVARPFLEDHRELSTDLDTALRDFNAFGEQAAASQTGGFEDWAAVTPAMWATVGIHLLDDDLGDSHRMVATGGIMARSLWFDHARRFFVPDSWRATSNFLIDTMDFTKMVSPQEWETIPEDQRKPSTPLDPAKVFHTMLVNEVQIELGSEEPYLDRLAELKAQLESSPSAATEEMLEGARMVFAEYRSTLTTLSELKSETILDRLDDEGAPNTAAWGPSAYSKGETGLRILADLD